MLDLICVEFLKLRRKKFVGLMLLTALVMPLFSVFYFAPLDKTGLEPVEFFKWTAFSYTPWIILPVALGLVCTMLMYDEHQHDVLKQLWMIPVRPALYYLAKASVVMAFSIAFMLLTAGASILTGFFAASLSPSGADIIYLLRKCLEIGGIAPLCMLPILAIAASQKGYILPVCASLVYTFLGFILLMVNMYIHPLSSMTAIVMRDIPGVVMQEPVDLLRGFVCIGVWGIASIVWAVITLSKRK